MAFPREILQYMDFLIISSGKLNNAKTEIEGSTCFSRFSSPCSAVLSASHFCLSLAVFLSRHKTETLPGHTLRILLSSV